MVNLEKKILNQHILSKNYTRASALVLTHTHTTTQAIRLSQNKQLKPRLPALRSRVPAHRAFLKKNSPSSRLPQTYHGNMQVTRSHQLTPTQAYIYINDLITLYYCYNSEAFSGIESTRARAHAPFYRFMNCVLQ